MIYRVYVEFKPGILDPEAEAIKKVIIQLGYKNLKKSQRVNFLILNCHLKTTFLI